MPNPRIILKYIGRMIEEDLFLPEKRSMAGNDRYLIVSCGGTGADALIAVKEKMEAELPAREIEERVRFLAIDTDKSTRMEVKQELGPDGAMLCREIERLTPKQFFHLSGYAARALFDCPLDSGLKSWLDPQLQEDIRFMPSYLDGNGACGIRQLGRLSLYPGETRFTLAGRIAALTRELMDNNAAPLKVFILTGIAGGTGSGIVIDLTYLIRHVTNSLPGIPRGRTKYCGFVLLPPTGKGAGQAEIDRGNCNGYAAMKEINRFMTLRERNDTYSFVYGDGYSVTSGENLFDACYLTDGTSDMVFATPRKQAVKVISESILDTICASLPTWHGYIYENVLCSYASDTVAFGTQMVSANSYKIAVRDADYVYSTLGRNELAFPAHEIKAYVGYKLFDKIYALFRRFEDVQEEEAMEFVKAVIRRSVVNNSAVASMEIELDNIFRDIWGRRGPFYAVNLLKQVSTATDELRKKIRIMRPGRISNEMLDEIDFAADCCYGSYEVYIMLLRAMREMVEKQYAQVVEAGVHGNTYSFMPSFMAANVQNSANIIAYLDGLIKPNNLERLAEALLEEMVNNRENWFTLTKSDTTATSNAPAAMRKFWDISLDEIVDSTLEDFLIKYYSGDPNAHYSTENHAATKPYLKAAANAIYNSMLGAGGAAQPMAHLTPTGLDADSFQWHTYLMVPRSAPHLLEELRNVADIYAVPGVNVTVVESTSADRIVCYKRYSSVPAYKLDWTSRAEMAYEQGLSGIAGKGLHLSENKGAVQWEDLPNLLPMSCWPLVDVGYNNLREANLAQRAHDLLAKASSLGPTCCEMMRTPDGKIGVYQVFCLPAEFRPDDTLYADVRRFPAGSDHYEFAKQSLDEAAIACAERLLAKMEHWSGPDRIRKDLEDVGVAFRTQRLGEPGIVMTQGPHGDHENWDQYIAGCVLRRMPETMYELETTILVMEKLVGMIEKAKREKALLKRFAQYLVTGVFTYNENGMQWEYTDEEDMTRKLVCVDTVEKAAEYYFMFNAFREDYVAVACAVAEKFAEKIPVGGDFDSMVVRQKEMKNDGKLLKNAIAKGIEDCSMRTLEGTMRDRGFDVDAIRSFYQALLKEAEFITKFGYEHVDINSGEEVCDFEGHILF